jgi:spore maturation protein CgeB
MRVIVAGDWHSDLHEAEVFKSLRRLGHETIEFKWFKYLSYDLSRKNSLLSIYKRVQNKYVTGPLISKINQDFIDLALSVKPQLIFIYRGTHIYSKSLSTLRFKLPLTKLVGYNNDDPYSPLQPHIYWRHFKRGIPEYDLILAYRHKNLEDYKLVGARRYELMRSWFVPERNLPVMLTREEKKIYECDVVFIGHYEKDNRLDFLEAIVNNGHKLRLFGPSKEWEGPLSRSKVLNSHGPLQIVWGDEYNKALCGARIALCFFSKLNRDTYTRRCFEIPATRTLLLSEYSEDLASLYEEGVEADFFRSKSEMLEKIAFYIRYPAVADKVAQAGYKKVKNSGHDIDSRIKEMLHLIK